MKYEEMDLAEVPSHFKFIKLIDDEMFRWEAYRPADDPKKEVPFDRFWWKYVYWVPKMKKEWYKLVLTSPDWETAVEDQLIALGADLVWFKREYRDLWKRMDWMRKNASANHIGELA